MATCNWVYHRPVPPKVSGGCSMLKDPPETFGGTGLWYTQLQMAITVLLTGQLANSSGFRRLAVGKNSDEKSPDVINRAYPLNGLCQRCGGGARPSAGSRLPAREG